MIRAVIYFLLVISVCNGGVGRLSPLSEFWKEHAQEKYPEMFEDETALALLCAPSFPWEIKHAEGLGVFNRYLIYVTQEGENHVIHLRDIYKDDERNFSFNISEDDFQKINDFFSGALKTLETFDRIVGDGTPYIIRSKGLENEFGYTWSPERFTYSSDISTVIRMLRDDCIRSIGRDFFLSPDTQDFMTIIELTPDSMREKFIERSESIEPSGPVDPFKEPSKKEIDSKVEASYLSAQLRLLFEYERKLMLTSR